MTDKLTLAGLKNTKGKDITLDNKREFSKVVDEKMEYGVVAEGREELKEAIGWGVTEIAKALRASEEARKRRLIINNKRHLFGSVRTIDAIKRGEGLS